tara:strand:- start:59 stop:721 length:663 start_codon:yes stop_codon:yes gene_type:complete
MRKAATPLKPFYMQNMLEAGIDEAGRGPLFGRVYVGAAILPQDDSFNHSLMKDSKKFSSKKKMREAYEYIKENAIDYQVAYIDEQIIDTINIRKATHKAMHNAVKGLRVKPEHLLVDGCDFTPYVELTNDDNFGFKTIAHTCIEGGDNKYTSIAAASILAKVERDTYIEKLCDEYPNLDEFYNLRSNKGYGAKKHIEGIKIHGITAWHRKTFGICKQYAN